MEQTGEYRIAANRDVVWDGLNDPAVLARCIDGCLSLERAAPDRFDARVKSRIGPVNATFDVELGLEDVVPPQHYTLRAQIKGGQAGFARGHAQVRLADDGDGTLLSYTVQGSVGGKLAQVGSRLIDAAARKMADDFFSAFQRELGGAPAPDAAAATAAGPEARAYQTGGNWKIWLAAFVALLLALLFAW